MFEPLPSALPATFHPSLFLTINISIHKKNILFFGDMAAFEVKVPVDEEAEQRQRSSVEEYKQNLINCRNLMSDLFLLQDR